jgi:hypothetical protein
LNFDPHSFNCYFLIPFVPSIFFSISHFNIWFIENWISRFFQIGRFRYNDLDHSFKNLTRFFFFKKKAWWFFLFFYQVIPISWSERQTWRDIMGWVGSDYRSYKFIMLTRVNQDQFFYVLFYPVLFFHIYWVVNWDILFVFFWTKYVFLMLSLSLFFLNLIHLLLFFILFHRIELRLAYSTQSGLWLELCFLLKHACGNWTLFLHTKKKKTVQPRDKV